VAIFNQFNAWLESVARNKLRAHRGFLTIAWWWGGGGRLSRGIRPNSAGQRHVGPSTSALKKYDMDKVPVTQCNVAIIAVITDSESGLPLSSLEQL
jgi:hypothetical protein